MALTTLNDVKRIAGIALTDESRDTQLRALIDGVSSLVKQQLNRNIEAENFTEYYSGDGTPYLVLRQYPVISVTRICVDGGGYFGDAPYAFPASLDLVEGVDFALMDGLNGKGGQGILRRVGGTWYGRPYREIGTVENLKPVKGGNILVEYRAGYEVIPAAIKMGVSMAIVQIAMSAAVGGTPSSMTYEDASVTYLTPDVAAKAWGSVAGLFANYKSIPV